jgi:hypothetical protein
MKGSCTLGYSFALKMSSKGLNLLAAGATGKAIP